ncbi:protein-serine O-palmitoleoyltransferase porcupine [Malaya genurostris]|uniref:protein-serine O-palmitoleoyltransferase porcupine n=1 Tax=Malaya genurostris TaxID=325434 RepID=UPI0026F3A01A|nr:protein-serine O-palmitoleoyltransferase porcupine [Malaya genurostris]
MADYLEDVYDENEYMYDLLYDADETTARRYESSEWIDTYENCVIPSLQQVLKFLIQFVIVNMLFCMGSKLQARFVPSHCSITHLLSLGCGLYLLSETVEYGFWYLFQLFLSSYFLFKISHIGERWLRFEFVISAYCILFLIICEIFESDLKLWHHIRGILMIAVMKIISLALDMKSKHHIKEQFGILSFLGYICSPANCIFGPWTSFSEYLNCIAKANKYFKFDISYTAQIVLNMACSALSMLLANCAYTLLISDYSWKWVAAYGAALSFRTSQYFVSFLSQATMVSAGHVISGSKSTKSRQAQLFGYIVTSPWNIELPRSLVHVVVAWNVPTHEFLKQYVFRILKPYGPFLAVFLTYVVSSILHGLNFQLWATLLTIGIWSYVEYNLRRKLADIFSACVAVKKCPVPCKKHSKSKNTLFSMTVNFLFSLLCVINLAYLGTVFDASSQLQAEGFSLTEAFGKWKNLGYVSHWLLLLGALINVVI